MHFSCHYPHANVPSNDLCVGPECTEDEVNQTILTSQSTKRKDESSLKMRDEDRKMMKKMENVLYNQIFC